VSVQKVTSRGRTRYRAITWVTDRSSPKGRSQVRRTFDTAREARAWEEDQRKAGRDGTYVARDRRTVNDLLNVWLAEKRGTLKATTHAGYVNAMLPVRAYMGQQPVQEVERHHLTALRDHLRETGGRGGRGRSTTTVRLALVILSQAFKWAVEEAQPRWVLESPFRGFRLPKAARTEQKAWTAEEAAAFLAVADKDRHAVAWRLTMLGMRRGEVLGLRWADVDLAAPSLTVRTTRVVAAGKVVEETPKSERSRRLLPLGGLPDLVRLLRQAQAAQRLERPEGVPWSPDDHVVVDALGQPVRPETYSQRFTDLCHAAGVPVIRLHDARHTALTHMLRAGVPVHITARWAGHDPVVLLRTYAHVVDEQWLTDAGAALGRAVSGGGLVDGEAL
jgi:integrase